MKALRFSSLGSLDALSVADVPLPERGKGDVLVKINAAGLNPSDAKNVLGKFPYTTLPRTPGRDFAGVVADGPKNIVGREVWGTGNELGFTRDGSHAEYMAVRADGVALKPRSLTFVQAAACGVPFVTAWSAIERTRVTTGSNVLVIGAAGSVGSAAVHLAKLRGAKVAGAVRRPEQALSVASGNAKPLLLKDNGSFAERVREIFAAGADVVFDTTGAWIAESVTALATYGRIAVIVAPGDGTANVPLRMMYRRGGSIVGVDSMLLDSHSCAGILTKIGALFDAGTIPVPRGITERPLKEAVASYRELESGGRGKIVLV